MSYDSYIKKNSDIPTDELYYPTLPKNRVLSLKQLLHSPLNRVNILPNAKPYEEGKDLNPTLHSRIQVIEKDAIDTAYIDMKDSNNKPILVDSNTLKPTMEEIAKRVADEFTIPGQKKIEKSPIVFAEESVYEIRRVNDILIKYSNQLHDKIINTDKVAELFIPLIRHSYLVVGFFHTKEISSERIPGGASAFRLKGNDKEVIRYEKEDPIKDIKQCINKLKSCEEQYTGLLKVNDVSIERVKELFNPLIKHANLLLGLYSQRIPISEGEILTELPKDGDIFIKVVKCNKAGSPIVTYHNILIISKGTEGIDNPFIELTILEDGNNEISNEKEVIENVYKSDLSKWIFFK